MELGLTGRTVVITGGSSGIGKAVAWEYLKEGCHVAVCSRGQARLEDAVREFQAAGYSVFARSLDVTDYPAVERFADEVAEAYGKINFKWMHLQQFFIGSGRMQAAVKCPKHCSSP